MAQSYRERREVDLRRGYVEHEVELRHLLEGDPSSSTAGECASPMDVLETTEGVEILMDLPGVAAGDVRILFSQGTLVVAGRKLPGGCPHREATFHLAERSFGRFVRAVRLTGAFDAGRASATLAAGQLRVALPRIEERRGRDIRIPITP
ncbi:MAG: Hsp20/alpha crystallin family protein [Vicinamibacterales bacterium]